MKKMGVGIHLAMVLMIMAVCFAAGSQHAEEEAGLRLPSQGGGVGGSRSKPWSCCDKCMCTKSIPPQCSCQDWLVGGCHSKCESCVELPMHIYPPYYVCTDVIEDYCGESCQTDPLRN